MAEENDRINIWIKLREAAKFAADARRARREIDGIGDSTNRASKGGKKMNREYTILGATLRQAKIGVTVGMLGLLAHAAVASGAGVFGLVAALAPLVGLLGALPAVGLLAGQGLGVAALGLLGVTDAVGGLNEVLDVDKFAALTGPAQDFALVLDALKPRIRGLQSEIGDGLFPGLTAGLLAAGPALDGLRGPLAGTGRELGGVASRLGHLVGSRGFMADLASQAEFNNVQIRRLGGGGIHLVNVLRNLAVGSRGLVSWLVKLVSGWAAGADRMITARRASGDLQRDFHNVQVTVSRVGRLLWNLGVALWNVGRVAKREVGDGLLLYLLRGSIALRRWTDSEQGVARLTTGFRDARRVLRDIRDFVLGIAHAAGPGAGDALGALIAAVVPLLSSGGGTTVLMLYVQGLALLANAALLLERNVPGASFALSALFALLVLNKVTGIFAAAKAFGLLGKAILLTALNTQIGVSAFWALNGAMAANPVGLIVLGIVALGTALYLAYTRIGWFHRAVDNVFDWITSNWQTLGAILIAPFSPLIAVLKAVVSNFGKIKNFVSGLPGKALGAAKSLIPGFAGGGIIRTPVRIVGEHGPELEVGAVGGRVFTRQETVSMLRAPRSAPVHRADPAGGAGGREIHVHSTHVLKVAGKTLAKVTDEQVAKQDGRE